jgi:fucose permease
VRSNSAANPAVLSRVRIATAGLFMINGVVGFSFLPRLVEIQADAGLDEAGLGVVLAVGVGGALFIGPLAGLLVQRWGAAPIAFVMGLACMPGLIAVGFATSGVGLAAALAVLLAADAMMDAAMNTRALEVQGAYGRSLINSFHGWWSLSTILGSGLGALSAVLMIPLSTFVIFVAGVCTVAILIMWSFGATRLPPLKTRSTDSFPSHRRFTLKLRSGGLLLILFIMCAVIVEDVPVRWGSIYLSDLGQSAFVIGIAYVAITTMMTIGRFVGDRLVDRWGGINVVRLSMAVAALTMALALIQGSAAAFIVASAVSGLAVATLFPLAMQAASALPGISPAMGVAIIAWFSRLGFAIAPLAVGLIAQAAGIRAGLMVFVGAAIFLVFIASAVARPRQVKQ